MKERNLIQVPVFVNSFFIVGGLGMGIMLLGVFRIFGIILPSTLLLGIAISSFIIVFTDYIVFLNRKIPFNYMNAFVMVSNFLAIGMVVCFPYLSLFNSEMILVYSDAVSLMSFGFTIATIGVRGSRELNSIIKQRKERIEALEKLLVVRDEEIEFYKGLLELDAEKDK
ncbi:hypothetical protein NQ117_05140 [Paenibacillus sp. SC116]|uniref:hypothetical protein n=1 Tax=Paenibacillus sp. SC116 TaxID=2968986 RepID=UPI00215A9BAE|nr:hypothetical protein [Paenibacillus sp. SC116]MCR8843057.1 hypothetical protein [Paenibacillus sp. SC116]